MATMTTQNPNPDNLNPNKTLDLSQPPSADPSLDPTNASQPSTTDDSPKDPPAQAKPSVAEKDAPVSDVQKKKIRAERFGISVQLSEQEKRNSRAERFGTASTTQASEELKRKARAERFGMPSPTAAADEDPKKKARLARFAPVTKTDPLEEDKRKARALRFSNPPSSSLPQVNGTENIETKEAVAGKAGGEA